MFVHQRWIFMSKLQLTVNDIVTQSEQLLYYQSCNINQPLNQMMHISAVLSLGKPALLLLISIRLSSGWSSSSTVNWFSLMDLLCVCVLASLMNQPLETVNILQTISLCFNIFCLKASTEKTLKSFTLMTFYTRRQASWHSYQQRKWA